MVHNGIEYGDMQLICEAYHIMKDVLGTVYNHNDLFGEWLCLTDLTIATDKNSEISPIYSSFAERQLVSCKLEFK